MYKELIKLDTSENWNKAKNFIPKLGEIIIYEDSNFLRRLKLGDGVTPVNDLPFVDINDYYIEDEETLVINTR